MNAYIESLYSKQLPKIDFEPSLYAPEYEDNPTEKEYAQEHLTAVLYWLYKAPKFDEIAFERSLEELCAHLDMSLPPELLARKIV